MPVMHRRPVVILGLALCCGIFLWPVPAAEASGALRGNSVPVGPLPDILCGCTEVLKNFA
jgi:hypothetical protein